MDASSTRGEPLDGLKRLGAPARWWRGAAWHLDDEERGLAVLISGQNSAQPVLAVTGAGHGWSAAGKESCRKLIPLLLAQTGRKLIAVRRNVVPKTRERLRSTRIF